MPYEIKQNVGGCKGFAVCKQGTTEVIGCHPSKSRAMAHMKALYANVKDVKKVNDENVWNNFFNPVNFYKREFSSSQRKKMAEEGSAMPDGSYPIANKKDLENAIRSWGRGGADPKVKSHIKARAKALGAENLIPDSWK